MWDWPYSTKLSPHLVWKWGLFYGIMLAHRTLSQIWIMLWMVIWIELGSKKRPSPSQTSVQDQHPWQQVPSQVILRPKPHVQGTLKPCLDTKGKTKPKTNTKLNLNNHDDILQSPIYLKFNEYGHDFARRLKKGAVTFTNGCTYGTGTHGNSL